MQTNAIKWLSKIFLFLVSEPKMIFCDLIFNKDFWINSRKKTCRREKSSLRLDKK
jgi:hypothetical protein